MRIPRKTPPDGVALLMHPFRERPRGPAPGVFGHAAGAPVDNERVHAVFAHRGDPEAGRTSTMTPTVKRAASLPFPGRVEAGGDRAHIQIDGRVSPCANP